MISTKKLRQNIFLNWYNKQRFCLVVYVNISSMKNLNINGRDVQRKNVVNNVEKSSLWAPWQNGPYKNTQNITKHGVYKDTTDIKK